MAALRINGPMRQKSLGSKLGVSRERLESMLQVLLVEERIERIADGMRDGRVMYMWSAKTGPSKSRERFSLPYNPAETLAAIRAAAIRTIFVGARV